MERIKLIERKKFLSNEIIKFQNELLNDCHNLKKTINDHGVQKTHFYMSKEGEYGEYLDNKITEYNLELKKIDKVLKEL